MPTIIEKIISRKIEAVIVFENEEIISFIDNNPINKGHLLICPKKQYENIYDLPDDLMFEIMKLSKHITQKMATNLNIDGVTLMQNNAGLNTLKHFHLHLIPRFHNDALKFDDIRVGNISIKEQNELLSKILS
jgi:histidine triad (HIT) family protein